MHSFKWLNLIFILFFLTAEATPEKPNIIKSLNNKVSIEYFEDKKGRLNIEEIKDLKFIKSNKKKIKFGWTKSAYWIKLTVDPINHNDHALYIVQDFQDIDYLDLYTPIGGNKYNKEQIGHSIDFEKRPFKVRELAFRVAPSIAEPTTYYLRYETRGKLLTIDLSLHSDKSFIEKSSVSQFAFGIFYGGLLVMLIYNLYLYFLIRDKAYLYYIYYLSTFIVTFFFLNGYSTFFIKGEPYIDGIFSAFGFLTIHGMILFTRTFLNMSTSLPIMDRVLKYWGYFLVLGAILAATVLNVGKAFSLLIYLILPSLPLLLAATFIRLHQGFKPALLYISGWAALVFFVILYALQVVGVLEANMFTYYGLQMASVWEAVIFAIALGQRNKQIEQAHRDALIRIEESRRLNERITAVLEGERKAIAAEIHDNFNSALVALKLNLQAIKTHFKEKKKDTQRVTKIVEKSLNLASEKYSSARTLVRRLRPEVIDTLGLAPALSELIDKYLLSNPEIHYKFDITGDIKKIEDDISMAIYRITQEALTNIIKYANASIVEIELKNTEGILILRISDNGVGFDTSTESGIGLISMRERANILSGKFNIESTPNKGTIITTMFTL